MSSKSIELDRGEMAFWGTLGCTAGLLNSGVLTPFRMNPACAAVGIASGKRRAMRNTRVMWTSEVGTLMARSPAARDLRYASARGRALQLTDDAFGGTGAHPVA